MSEDETVKNWCPVWEERGHLWVTIKDTFLLWRYYRVCISCSHWERIKR